MKAYVDGDYARAAKILKTYAVNEDAFTQYMLGDMYYFGRGVTQD